MTLRASLSRKRGRPKYEKARVLRANLVPVRKLPDATRILWDLLHEREPYMNISHNAIPSYEEHEKFVAEHPYRTWYIIRSGGAPVGSIYLTTRNEVGIFIFKAYQGMGYGDWALRTLISRWRRAIHFQKSTVRKAFVANIAPANVASKLFFEKHGFKLVQHTYALDVDPLDHYAASPTKKL